MKISRELSNAKKSLEKVKNLKVDYFLLGSILFSLVTKLLLIKDSVFPFVFDHGKDSLAVLHMIKTYSPKLIGPWTSISGLYFGPGWYYLLAPGFWLTNGHPISAVITMIVLNLVTIYLAYKHFGKIEALIIACSPVWILLSTSAWNPFPMPLLMLIILINLKKEKLEWKNYFVIGLASSLAFHFSSAFAFFYLITLPIIWFYKILKNKEIVNWKLIGIFIIGFIIPFIPQVTFELRHNFVETKAIINYLKNPPEAKVERSFLEIIIKSTGEMLNLLPQISGSSNQIWNKLFKFFCLGLIMIGIKNKVIRKKKINFIFEFLIFSIIPMIGFYFLHFNEWYVYALLVTTVVFLSQFIKESPKFLQLILILLFMITPISKVIINYQQERAIFVGDRAFLPVKIQAIEKIYELSNGENFKSYHYVPDIYDYAFQYIYIWKGFNEEKILPVEFSYEGGKIDYIKEKPELLTKLKSQSGDPKYIFYIVEKPEHQILLDEWWSRQNYKEIIWQEKLSESVTLYQALPKI